MLESKLGLRASVLAVVAVGMLGVGVAPANADDLPSLPLPPITLTEEQRSNILGQFARFDVDPAQRLGLLDKLEDGEGWDSLSDAEPINESNEIIEGFNYTISRFADGSFVAAGIEEPKQADPNARAIQSCSTSGTSAGVAYRTNCTIIVTNGATSGQFQASFSYWASGSSIYNVGSGVINSDVGVAGGGNFSSSTAPGTTKWTQFNWTTKIEGWYQSTRYVRLTVTTGGGTSSANY